MKKVKIKYLVVIGIFLVIIVIGAYLGIDYENDKKYLADQGFENVGKSMRKEFVGYDNYCIPRSDIQDVGIVCEVVYNGVFFSPNMSANINFGDGTMLIYTKSKHGLFKNEATAVSIMTNIYSDDTQSAYCQIDDDFTVVTSDENNSFCYTENYTKYIEEHKQYIDDALEEYNKYYTNFSISRDYS